MKSFLSVFSLLFLSLFSLSVFAQVAAPAVPAVAAAQPVVQAVSNQDFLNLLLASLGGLKGVGLLGGIGVAVNILIKFLSTPICGTFFPKLSGAMKLTLVLALTLVAGVAGLMTQGLTIGAALMHSTTLGAFMVLANQMLKQYLPQDNSAPTPPAQS